MALERLLNNDDSFDFFKQVVDNKADYQDLEENYRDIREFFHDQLPTWNKLQLGLRNFDKNRQALEKDSDVARALLELRSIQSAEAPYSMLHKVASLVTAVETVNERLLTDKRAEAVTTVEDKIKKLQLEIDKSGIATVELSNRLLRPLQLVKEGVSTESSISTIYMLHTETKTT